MYDLHVADISLMHICLLSELLVTPVADLGFGQGPQKNFSRFLSTWKLMHFELSNMYFPTPGTFSSIFSAYFCGGSLQNIY